MSRDDRAERLARELRENLKRRKAQSRAAAEPPGATADRSLPDGGQGEPQAE
ncbi:hypothetical protein [Sphingomonas corticis]|jgi:hypothetical protein|uniref:DUF4169 family protein n=1 Tax=Sphingomonas corticis TaxID=2722791 RepID=A0ABX1CPA0_9SPHN|nr:hypothetical protein [Sphingomonas corticis]NJR77900.1 hypothetical protein [Sphingomonas corticis]